MLCLPCCLTATLAVVVSFLLPPSLPAATIWQEGETPTSHTMNRHPWW